MTGTIPPGSNWGHVSLNEQSISLLRNPDETLISVPLSQIENCTQFRNDVKVQIRKAACDEQLSQREEVFYTAPCEIKLTISPSDRKEEDAMGEAPSDYSSAKAICSTIHSSIAQFRDKYHPSTSNGKNSTPPAAEMLRIPSLPVSTPHGYFDMTITASSLIMHREKKASSTEERAQTGFEIGLSNIHCTFLLPFPLTNAKKSNFARKYFVLALTEPVIVGSTKHHYIVFAIDDDDVFTIDAPLKTCFKTSDDVVKFFNGKISPAETMTNEESSCVSLLGTKSELLAKIIKGITGKKILGQSSFHNATNPADTVAPYVPCINKASSGHLYLLEKSFIFLHKPVFFVNYDDVKECSMNTDSPYTKTYTIQFVFKGSEASKKNLKLTNIPHEEADVLKAWFVSKGISVIKETASISNISESDSDSSYSEESD
ncbi:FACT complex subunit SSRP1 [Perkinsela sp. CCAP 1560/4]|nr:FACT complex subunit SSRP1 [Perkinsela sp. CCAP 1560/4]|eukprot:KNH03692.1 FACT complex subunit SSRP1 [Perkinsela sp. CCAP 1560/4]